MATTYGYGGEFSSDEDIDRVEQQSERIIQSKFNDNINTRPSTQQIEATIEAIRNLSPDEDMYLSDDVLAALLDHYKTQRGPIVDSTRKLYKKIVLRIIREGAQQQGNDATNDNSNNPKNNNNNDMEIFAKQRSEYIDSFSSDDEELESPASGVVLKEPSDVQAEGESNVEQMEVDSETPTGLARETKQVDISSDDDEDEDEKSSEDSEELNSDSDVLDVTPIKPPNSCQTQSVVSKDRARSAASALSTPRQAHTESSVKRQPLAQSTPKESATGTAKKPFTRSQRLAASRAAATSNEKASESFIGSKSAATSSNDGKRVSRKKFAVFTITILVLVLAFLLYHFRVSLFKPLASTGGSSFSNKINFG